MTRPPAYVIGSWCRSTEDMKPCERCGALSTRMARVYRAPYDPRERRTPTLWLCPVCATALTGERSIWP